MFEKISNGLLVTDFPHLKENLVKVLETLAISYPFIDESQKFDLLQTQNGGRKSRIFPKYDMDSYPKSNSEELNSILSEMIDFKKSIFKELVKNYPALSTLEYEKCTSFHTYTTSNNEGEHGFSEHIDFGMIAIVFTLGRDFEYSEDNGKSWIKLSDHEKVNKNSVIINFGRLYSTFTGEDPVLHRVTANGNLSKYGFPCVSKFTVGFFIDIKSDTNIPKDIPENIKGNNRKNWEFMISNFKNIGNYNEKRISGEVYEVDGILMMK